MRQQTKLEIYCAKMLLNVEVDEGFLEIENKLYVIVDEDEMLFDEDMEFLPEEVDETDGWVYEFGGRWFLQEIGEETSMDELKWKGKAIQKIPTESFLGIHSGYEILNGVGLYKEWIKKAQFLGIKTLGICEKNTLAGAMAFQNICLQNNIKPIIGMTVSVSKDLLTYDMKLYAQNFQGWLNLLSLSEIINVDEKIAIPEEELLKRLEGIIPILDPKTLPFEKNPIPYAMYSLDTVIFESADIDKDYIDNLEKYIQSSLPPISIIDAYYIEQEDWKAREVLWGVAKKYDYKTKNQYFKNNDQYAKELIAMFEPGEKTWVKLFQEGTANQAILVDQCNFEYDTKTRHLPKYIMTEKEAGEFDTNEELFIHLIKLGFKERNIQDTQKYIERLKVEIEVLRMGDVIDYFLSLYDIIQFAKREKMLTGIGRGSAGGSLVAYLLGIIQIDPIQFDLLFERFLNSGRMGEMQDRPAFEIELEDGSKRMLAEGTLVAIMRDKKEQVLFIQDLKEGDEILRY